MSDLLAPPSGTGALSSFASALSDPGVDALLGMAQGFAQAAMPTRMPTPFGAVLGMGGGGALQGLKTSQQLQQAAAQTQAAQMQNQMTRMYMGALPSVVSGGVSGQPSSGASGSGAVSSFPVASSPDQNAPSGAPQTDANGQYLVPPSRFVALGNLALMRGDPAAAAKLFEMSQTPAGGPGYAMSPTGAAFAVPGGKDDPRVLAGNAFSTARGSEVGKAPFVAPQYFDVPTIDSAGNPALDATGQPTFHKQLMTVPQATAAAGSGAGNTSYADPFPGWATRINGGENGTGNPAALNASGPGGTPTSSAMGNGQFLESTWPAVIRAVRPDIAAGKTDAQLLPLRAVPGLAQSATEQYARQNGATLAAAGLPVNGGTVALAHFLGPTGAQTVLSANASAPLSMLPGMAPVLAANPSLRGMTAGGLTQQYQTRMAAPSPQLPGISGPPVPTPQQAPYDLRSGGMHVDPTTGTVVKNPEPVKITTPGGQVIQGHMNPASPFAPEGTPGTFAPVLTPPPAPGTVSPGGAAPGSPIVTNLAPDVVEGREELTKGLFGKDADSFVAANNTQGWLNQINHAANVMNQAGGAYQTGPFASQRMALMGAINDAGRSLSLGQPFDTNALSSAEEMRKATTTAGFELSSHYEGHARQAAATIMNATSAVPGMSNSPTGVTLVSNGINEGAQSAIDMHNYNLARFHGQDPYGIAPQANGVTGGAGLESAESDYVKAFPASMYSDRAISTVNPVKITSSDQSQAMEQMSHYLPGTVVVLPNGKQSMVPPRPGAPPIPNYLRSYLQAPGQ